MWLECMPIMHLLIQQFGKIVGSQFIGVWISMRTKIQHSVIGPEIIFVGYTVEFIPMAEHTSLLSLFLRSLSRHAMHTSFFACVFSHCMSISRQKCVPQTGKTSCYFVKILFYFCCTGEHVLSPCWISWGRQDNSTIVCMCVCVVPRRGYLEK